jgi:hypothetical protein
MRWNIAGCWLREYEGFHELEIKSIATTSDSFFLQ